MSGRHRDSVGPFSEHEAVCETAELTYSTADQHVVVDVPGGRKCVVYHFYIKSRGTQTCQWRSGEDGTDLTGAIELSDTNTWEGRNGGFPVLKTTLSGDNLVLVLTAAVQVDGFVTYALVDARA